MHDLGRPINLDEQGASVRPTRLSQMDAKFALHLLGDALYNRHQQFQLAPPLIDGCRALWALQNSEFAIHQKSFMTIYAFTHTAKSRCAVLI